MSADHLRRPSRAVCISSRLQGGLGAVHASAAEGDCLTTPDRVETLNPPEVAFVDGMSASGDREGAT
jgi:hypothetical protein